MAELDEISRVHRHFSPHFLLIFLIYLARALAILCKLGEKYSCRSKLLGFRNGLDRYLNNPRTRKASSVPAVQPNVRRHTLRHEEARGVKRQTQTCATEREELQRLKERRYHFYAMSGFMTACISILSTWTRRAKKLDEVQFSIPQG